MTERKRKTTETEIEMSINKSISTHINYRTLNKYDNICFIVKSTISPGITYNIFLDFSNGVKMECTCGDKYGVTPRRNHCKHIGSIVGDIVKKFVLNHIEYKDPKDDDSNIDDIIDKFKDMLK